MALMVSRHVQHLPVVMDGKLIGMVSVRDLLQLRLEEVLAEAEAMQKYIGGGSGGVKRWALPEPQEPGPWR